MHSSIMHTTRFLPYIEVLRPGLSVGGGLCPGGGVSVQGVPVRGVLCPPNIQ